MKTDPRRFAPAGLALSIIALLAGLGVLIAKGLDYVGLYTPTNPDLLNQIGYASLAGLVAGLALYALLDPEKTRTILTGRQVQYGSTALISLLAFTGIVIAVNVIAYQNPVKWDWTEDRSNTLAPETITTLSSLTEPVTATAFYTGRLNPESARTLLENFRSNSKGKFAYQFVDPETNPVAAQNAGITADGQILLEMAGRRELIDFASERELLGGILRLMNPSQSVIYFLSGHGERDIAASGTDTYSQLADNLRNKNYIVQPLNLLAQGSIPEDARVIVIAGPLTPVTQTEVDLIDAFLKKGGSLIVMQDPLPATQFGEQPDPLGAYLSATWGITYNNDIVIDPSSTQALMAIAYSYGSHPITQRMQNIAAGFPLARSLSAAAPSNSSVTVTALVNTIDRSWGETDFTSIENNQVGYTEGQDIPGPLTIAATAQDFVTQGRVVVFGNSTFAENNFLALNGGANNRMALNAVDWAAAQENLIDLTPNTTTQRTFQPPSNLGLIGMILLSVCVIPLGIIGLGLFNWVSRRKRG
ncbi:MAG: GldG family protein [Anaerolineales bacterium]